MIHQTFLVQSLHHVRDGGSLGPQMRRNGSRTGPLAALFSQTEDGLEVILLRARSHGRSLR
jgi:hypothetical protein